MVEKEIYTVKITELPTESVMNSTINMIQTVSDESLRRKMINRFCGRLIIWDDIFKEDRPMLKGTYQPPEEIFPLREDKPIPSLGEGSVSTEISSPIKKMIERINLQRARKERILH